VADGKIEIEVEVSGTDEAARGIEDLKDGFGDFKTGLVAVGGTLAAVGAAIVGGTAALRAFAMEADRQAGIQQNFTGSLTQSRQAMGGMVSELQMMEAHSRLAAAGINLSGRDLRNVLVAAFQQAERTGGEFNATLDQLGQAIQRGGRGLQQFGITAQGSAGALEELNTRFGETEVAADSLGDRFEQIDVAMADMSTAFMQGVSDTGSLETAFMDFFNAVGGGATSFEDAMSRMVEAAGFMGVSLGRHLDALRTLAQSHNQAWRRLLAGDFSGAAESFGRGNDTIRSVVSGDVSRAAFSEFQDNQFAREQSAGAAAQQPTTITRRGGGGRSSGRDRFSADEMDASSGREAEFANDLAEEGFAERREMWDAEQEIRREMHDEQLAMADELKDKQREDAEFRADMLEQEKAKAREAYEEVKEDALGILGPVVKGITSALRDVIAGTKSADEAFQGLLSSFLEMIAQEAALSAAKEFASAIASFASQDYGGGALHLAAGAAWTGVAIAAGAASVAVAPSASAPAEPEQNTQGSGGGEQTVIIQWNSPVVTSATYADLGQQMGDMVNAGQRRYGRAA
jgi:hypothetical protein